MAKVTCMGVLVGVLHCIGSIGTCSANEDVTRHHASFRAVEVGGDGKSQLIAAPELVFATGESASIEITDESGKPLKVKITAVAKNGSTQYVTEFAISAAGRILSNPKIVTSSGQKGRASIGDDNGPRTDYFVIASEFMANEEDE